MGEGDPGAGADSRVAGAWDRWYHSYHRRFDGLTSFRAQSAPFVLQLDGPFDFRLGSGQLLLTLRGTLDRSVDVTACLTLRTLEEDRGCRERTIRLPAGGTGTVVWPVELTKPGGGLLILSLAAELPSV